MPRNVRRSVEISVSQPKAYFMAGCTLVVTSQWSLPATLSVYSLAEPGSQLRQVGSMERWQLLGLSFKHLRITT